MTDLAQLREALDKTFMPPNLKGDSVKWDQWFEYDGMVRGAARELLTLREAGALIIVPDENGDFPAWAVEEALMWKMGQRPDGLFNALRDAMPPEDSE